MCFTHSLHDLRDRVAANGRRTVAVMNLAATVLVLAYAPALAGLPNESGGHLSVPAATSDASPFGTVPVAQPPPPCHPNPTAMLDGVTVAHRGDIVNLPAPLHDRLVELAERPHSVLPVQARAEANEPSLLFQYYLLDTHGFEPNVFTHLFPGINDQVMLTVTGANCGQPTIGSVRAVLEPKPGLPTDPNNPRAFIDIFTDIDPLFVINNESGWY